MVDAPQRQIPRILVTHDLTRKVANLARLELTDQEVTTFTSQLSDILSYVGQLQELDVSNVEPLTHPFADGGEIRAPLREDIVKPFKTNEDGKPKTLDPAPEAYEGGFKVPPIL
jgi:aspartyl-tRNA(Asn)/glutamyl-tRNA(Gln) amidotransferase subunit C